MTRPAGSGGAYEAGFPRATVPNRPAIVAAGGAAVVATLAYRVGEAGRDVFAYVFRRARGMTPAAAEAVDGRSATAGPPADDRVPAAAVTTTGGSS